jgi:phosphoglycolate phosphatase-like HAD superfamily hydrolase
MKTLRLLIFATIAIIVLGCSQSSQQHELAISDPLDQWNEGPVKTSILSFVKAVTDKASPGFIAIPDRVAVFDMDGTILLEKPNPVNFDVIIRILVEQMASNPALTQKQPYKAIHKQDWAYFDTLGYYGDDGLYSILLKATVGYTEDQYKDFILEYFKTVTDKRFNKPYNQLVYVPVVQLIRYLQDNQFEVYIVSGSDPQFTRTFCEDAANIPSCNVIGTTILTEWVETDTGSCFIRVHEFVQPINDEGGKAVNILNKVGKVPVIAVGNSPGDYHMLEYSKNSPLSLQMIVNHDDSLREYYYDFEKMKTMCQEHGWQEISMKKDFKVIFSE